MEKMSVDDRIKCVKEIQNLRNHIENTEIALEDVESVEVGKYLTLIWTEVESLLEFLI